VAYFPDKLRGARTLQIDLGPEMGAAANKIHQVSPFQGARDDRAQHLTASRHVLDARIVMRFVESANLSPFAN
jgi:hypothetical protein